MVEWDARPNHAFVPFFASQIEAWGISMLNSLSRGGRGGGGGGRYSLKGLCIKYINTNRDIKFRFKLQRG